MWKKHPGLILTLVALGLFWKVTFGANPDGPTSGRVGMIITAFLMLFFAWCHTMFGSWRNVGVVLTAYATIGFVIVFSFWITLFTFAHIILGTPIQDERGVYRLTIGLITSFFKMLF